MRCFTIQSDVVRHEGPMLSKIGSQKYRAQFAKQLARIIFCNHSPLRATDTFQRICRFTYHGVAAESARLLREFDERLFTHHPNEHLRNKEGM